MPDVTCEECARVFTVKQSQAAKRRYCSAACWRARPRITNPNGCPAESRIKRSLPVNATCEECGAKFHVPPSMVGRRRFCGWRCRSARPRNYRTDAPRVEWRCEVCGLRRLKQPSETYRRFCSQLCRDRQPRVSTKIAKVCGSCGILMFVPPSGVERKKYCSRRCAGLGRPLNGKPSKIATAAVAAFIERTPVLAVPEFRVGHWSIDLAFPLQMVALELDGCYWHSLPAMVEKDRRKDEALRAAGWSVVRVVIETRDDVENVVQRMNQVMREWIPRRRR